jgi:hypothetical protein
MEILASTAEKSTVMSSPSIVTRVPTCDNRGATLTASNQQFAKQYSFPSLDPYISAMAKSSSGIVEQHEKCNPDTADDHRPQAREQRPRMANRRASLSVVLIVVDTVSTGKQSTLSATDGALRKYGDFSSHAGMYLNEDNIYTSCRKKLGEI